MTLLLFGTTFDFMNMTSFWIDCPVGVVLLFFGSLILESDAGELLLVP